MRGMKTTAGSKTRASYERKNTLEGYVESLVSLPPNVVKGMTLLRKLDIDIEEGIEDLEEIIRNNPESLSEEDISKNFRIFRTYSDEKVAIAAKLDNILDNHVDDCKESIDQLEQIIHESAKKMKKRQSRRQVRSKYGKVDPLPPPHPARPLSRPIGRPRNQPQPAPQNYRPQRKYARRRGRSRKNRLVTTERTDSTERIGRKRRRNSSKKSLSSSRVRKPPYDPRYSTRASDIPLRSRLRSKKSLISGASAAGKIPAEEIFCYCNRPSFGGMVACENENCKRKWFHFECLGIESAPETELWYCKECKSLMKK